MTELIVSFFVGGLVVCILYFVTLRDLQHKIDVLQKLLSIAIAQREAALSGKDRAHIQRLYQDGLRHYGLDKYSKSVDDVLSGRAAGPVVEKN